MTAVMPDGRKLLPSSAQRADADREEAAWIKTKLRTGPSTPSSSRCCGARAAHGFRGAGCPNIYECWEDRELPSSRRRPCTRRCDFCQIDTGKPAALDIDEPRRVAESVQAMGLRYATVTGVARDDLADGGAWLYAETVRQIHALNPGTGVELLIPDFNATPALLDEVFGAEPEVLAHNLETVPRIFKQIRPGFRFDRSLDVIRQARAAGLVTKSNLILGMGEERAEVTDAMRQLRNAGCDLLTITQYLRPLSATTRDPWCDRRSSSSSAGGGVARLRRSLVRPLVRSSYRAGRLTRRPSRRAGPPRLSSPGWFPCGRHAGRLRSRDASMCCQGRCAGMGPLLHRKGC